MSKGNPHIKLRIDALLLAEIWEYIHSRNLVTRKEPWDMSGFLKAAIHEFMRKRKAGNRPRTRKAPKT